MNEPDREESIIRFGCGVVFGLVVVGLPLLLSGLSWPWWLFIVTTVTVFFGYKAWKKGDDFWWSALETHHKCRWWWWLPW